MTMLTQDDRAVLAEAIDRAWADKACFTYRSLARLIRACPPEERAELHAFLRRAFQERGQTPPERIPYVLAYVRTDRFPNGTQYVRHASPERLYCTLVETCNQAHYEGAIRQRQAILDRKTLNN